MTLASKSLHFATWSLFCLAGSVPLFADVPVTGGDGSHVSDKTGITEGILSLRTGEKIRVYAEFNPDGKKTLWRVARKEDPEDSVIEFRRDTASMHSLAVNNPFDQALLYDAVQQVKDGGVNKPVTKCRMPILEGEMSFLFLGPRVIQILDIELVGDGFKPRCDR